MNIITFNQIRELYGLTYWEARRYLNTKGCPVLPRKKGQHYKVVQEKFEEWLLCQVKK